MSVTEASVRAFMNDPLGPVRIELQRVAGEIVKQQVQDSLGNQVYPIEEFGKKKFRKLRSTGRPVPFWPPNPLPGPPNKRSGRLQAAVTVGAPGLDVDGVIAIPITAPVEKRGYRYDRILHERGYHFIDSSKYPNYIFRPG